MRLTFFLLPCSVLFVTFFGQSIAICAPAAPPAISAKPRVDLTLLQKALQSIIHSKAILSESDLDIYASKAGTQFILHDHLRVTAHRPGRFTSDVTLSGAPGKTAQRYRVASDGLKVTIFQPALKKYAVTPLTPFKAGNDNFPSLGLAIGLLYLGDMSMINGITALAKDKTDQQQALLHKVGMVLTRKSAIVHGVAYEVFSLQVGKRGTYRFFVDPATEQIALLELRLVQNSVSLRIMETIRSFTPQPSIPANTFHLAIPPGTQKVKTLAVSFS